jgi:alpha-ketoglutarate-dependent taurine dioxygenase
MSTQIEAQLQPSRERFRIKERGSGGLGAQMFLADVRARLDALQWRTFELRPLGTSIGAEIRGLALGEPLDDATVAELRAALLAHKVLVFRDQDLDAERQSAFARRFGELEVHPFLQGSDDTPELVRFEKGVDVAGYENVWHSDVTWRERPALGAVLRAIEVPRYGGDTLWADMAAAYLGLDDRTRERLEGLVAVHDFTQSFGQGLSPEQLAEAQQVYPSVEHPVVRTHPETGERILYVNRIFTSHIVDMDPDESEALLGDLCGMAEVPEFQVRLQWEPGTVAMWDNRATQHYAVSDYWPQVRIMERAAIIGDRPA